MRVYKIKDHGSQQTNKQTNKQLFEQQRQVDLQKNWPDKIKKTVEGENEYFIVIAKREPDGIQIDGANNGFTTNEVRELAAALVQVVMNSANKQAYKQNLN